MKAFERDKMACWNGIPKAVDSPQHYGGRECINAMREAFGDAAIKDFAICNAMKYLWRHQKKGGREDIEKAIWYLKYWLEVEDDDGGESAREV